ncbi:hypothetical protein COO60DRAFT_1621686 [Scenedesmus sp. NREL 46B-D3]|nr:hypothetical protein COO60DRAFT_1621686 [Scenedesmus sp. NREL 46B-D3]
MQRSATGCNAKRCRMRMRNLDDHCSDHKGLFLVSAVLRRTAKMGLSMEVDRFFKVTERGSTIGTEIKAGIATFLTMSYILLVNPQILGAAGLPVKAVVTATALSSTLASLLCGLTANLPVGMSPGMGLNAYLVFSQVVGMGLLLTFIGLQSSKIVVPDKETMVTMGDLLGLEPVLAIGGLAVIASLHFRNVKGSIIIGIMVTALAYFTLKDTWPTEFLALPHLQTFELDFSDLFATPKTAAWSAVLAYALVMIFDIGGAMFGLGNLAGLVKDGQVPGAVVTYLSAAASTALGALTGTTPLIIAAESAVGIKEGGRTGLVAVTVSGCFLCSMFLAPLLQAIPQVATAPVLVLVGAMMMGESTHIDWSSMMTAVPAFLTIVIQPFTFSIANGIYAGLVMSILLYVLTGSFLETLGFGGFGASKREAGAQEDLEAYVPVLDGHEYAAHQHAAAASGASAVGIVDSNGMDVQRGASSLSVPVGSLPSGSRGTPYERGSFSMYINTFGSHAASPGGLLLGSQLGAGSRVGSHMGSEEPEH